MHGDGGVACLLLLLLDSGNEVDHAFPFGWDPNLRPAVKVKLSDQPALLLGG